MLLLGLAVDFRKAMYEKFCSEYLNFVTLTSYPCQCALKITGQEFELLTGANMIFDYENGIKGGMTRAIHHYVEANNK